MSAVRWSLALLLVGTPLLLGARHWSLPATVPITVNARCAGPNTTEVSVRPWNVRIRQGDELRWVLAPTANTESITITPKASSDWPFASRRPMVGTKAAAARASGMRADGRGSYKYDITLVCRAGNAPPDTVVIDPDVIVD